MALAHSHEWGSDVFLVQGTDSKVLILGHLSPILQRNSTRPRLGEYLLEALPHQLCLHGLCQGGSLAWHVAWQRWGGAINSSNAAPVVPSEVAIDPRVDASPLLVDEKETADMRAASIAVASTLLRQVIMRALEAAGADAR